MPRNLSTPPAEIPLTGPPAVFTTGPAAAVPGATAATEESASAAKRNAPGRFDDAFRIWFLCGLTCSCGPRRGVRSGNGASLRRGRIARACHGWAPGQRSDPTRRRAATAPEGGRPPWVPGRRCGTAGRAALGRQVSREPGGDGLDLRYLVRSGAGIALGPARHLAPHVPLRLPRRGETGARQVDAVQLGEVVDERRRGGPQETGGQARCRRVAPQHHAADALHEVEARPDERLVLAEDDGPRRSRVHALDRREDRELAPHVVGALHPRPEGRPAQPRLPAHLAGLVQERPPPAARALGIHGGPC